jgi:hypothetical protein
MGGNVDNGGEMWWWGRVEVEGGGGWGVNRTSMVYQLTVVGDKIIMSLDVWQGGTRFMSQPIG